MREKVTRKLQLSLPAATGLTATVQGLIENGARAFALAEAEALALTLAGEEVFSYISQVIRPAGDINLSLSEGLYFVSADFELAAGELDLKALNLTTTVDFQDDSSLQQMGLLIAARMVDQLQLDESPAGRFRLRLRKERRYPTVARRPGRDEPPLPPLQSRLAEAEEIEFICAAARRAYPDDLLPKGFNSPGRVIDMVAAGDLKAALVTDRQGRIGGGIFWFKSGRRLIEVEGPFLVNGLDQPEARRRGAEMLVEFCLNDCARRAEVGLLCRRPSPDLPSTYFETLGEAGTDDYHAPACFRQIHEDPGALVRAAPELHDFLARRYQLLALPRELDVIGEVGAGRRGDSVLAAELDHGAGQARLRLLWPGGDLAANLEAHLKLLRREQFTRVDFELDLGINRQAGCGPILLAAGFKPELLLPWGGRGDLLIMIQEI